MAMHETTTRNGTTLYRAWLEEYAGLIYKVAHAFTATDADRDDLTQEILLQLWISLPTFEGNSKPSTWIYRLALNTALAWKRKEKKHASRIALLEIEDLPATPAESTLREDRELIDALYTAIRSLPRVDAALVMMYLDDLSYRDMAEVLGISEDNVGIKLHRIKKALAESMKGFAHESG
jgi:RNA polymerase sigma-70 factor, ECF subfamily